MIELRDFSRADFRQLIDWIDSPEFLLQWGGSDFSFPLDEKQLESYLKEAEGDDTNEFLYSVVSKETGKVIGHISLSRIDDRNKSARIGRVLVGDKSVRGKGIGEQMIKEVLKIAFDRLKLHRVSLGVFDFNKPAISCYEKAGFIKEGVRRDSKKINNEYWDLIEMSILEEEWLEKKKNN